MTSLSVQAVVTSGFSALLGLSSAAFAEQHRWIDFGFSLSKATLDRAVQDTERAGHFLNFSSQIEKIYRNAEREEDHNDPLPSAQAPDFSSIRHRFPNVSIVPQRLPDFPFCRVWNLDHTGMPAAPNFVVVAPNSGNTVEKVLGTAETFLGMGNVRLVEYLDPRHVPAAHKIDLDSSARAVAEIACINPGCYLAGPSHGGLVATLAAGLVPDKVAGLIVIGSPVDPQAADSAANQAARIQQFFPQHFIKVGKNRAGRGRRILPRGAMQLVYREVIGEVCESNDPQALPAELVSGPHGMLRWYNESPLAKTGIAAFKGHVVMIVGRDDHIVPADQTLSLKKFTPQAASHTSHTLKTGHYGLLKSEILAPALAEILEAKDPAIRAFRQGHRYPLQLAS